MPTDQSVRVIGIFSSELPSSQVTQVDKNKQQQQKEKKIKAARTLFKDIFYWKYLSFEWSCMFKRLGHPWMDLSTLLDLFLWSHYRAPSSMLTILFNNHSYF